MFAVQTINGNAQARVVVAFPFHHVVLRLAEESMLRTKKSCESKKLSIVSLQNSRSVLEFCRNGRRMKQRPDACAPKFIWPEIAQIIEWKCDGHGMR